MTLVRGFIILIICTIIVSCRPSRELVIIQTELGDITVAIYSDKAPLTAANFLRYVDENIFEYGSFYRTVHRNNQPRDSVKIEVIQGGISRDKREYTHAPIAHETTNTTGVFHTDGAISMARARPGTASTEFFICIGAQPALDYGGLRNADGQGFSAFGRVIRGMDVAKKIHAQPCEGQSLTPRVLISSITRAN